MWEGCGNAVVNVGVGMELQLWMKDEREGME